MKKIILLLCIVLLTSCSPQGDFSSEDNLQQGKTKIENGTQEPQVKIVDENSSTKQPTETLMPSSAPTSVPTLVPTEPPYSTDLDKLDNTKNGWGFRRMPNARPEFTKGQIDMMDKYNCIYMGSEEVKNVYLTFDEGYENGYTASILDSLLKTGVKATFFITGPYLEKSRDLVDRMVLEGHTVGNHTVNHPNLPNIKERKKMEEEVLSLDRKFYEIYGKHMKYLRAPEGSYSERSLAITSALGYTNVFWSLAYKDWETNNQKGSTYAYKQVMDNIHNGCVLLLHAVSKDNAEALESIITDVKGKGFTFESLDNYRR